jgi:serine protease Do/serine protease DegQ
MAVLLLALLIHVAASPPVDAAPPVTIDRGPDGLPTLAPMLEEVIPQVVNIAVRSRVPLEMNPLFQDPFFRRFFRLPEQRRQREVRSAGSGVIVDAEEGYVITNEHVIRGGEGIAVTLRDGRQLDAEIVGKDPETDLALLRIPAEDLQAVSFGDSEMLQVGDFVVAIGNPFGLGHTVTSGIVSALGRTGLGIEGYEDFIQTDASINPGNSGGALVNLRGELVGINTAIVAPAGGNVGIGFAIPANMARGVMEQLIEFGEVRRGQLGVIVQNVTPALAAAFGLERAEGALVSKVVSGSAAKDAGVEPGDVIVRIGDAPIRSAADLRNRLGIVRTGEELTLELVRKGKTRTVRVTTRAPTEMRAEGETAHRLLAGAVLGPIDESSRIAGEIDGVEVEEVERGSPAWRLGLRPGDIITSVNRQSVGSVEDVNRIAQAGGRGILLNIQRGGAALFLFAQ